MSWMTPRERDFSQAGPFVAKRGGNAGDIELIPGEVYTAADLAAANLTHRHIQRMYAAHWLDMATATVVSLEPSGEGHSAPTGSEGADDTEQGAEALETPENPPSADETGAGDVAAGDEQAEPGAPQGAAEATEEGGAAAGDTATPPSDTVTASYRCIGFGHYYAHNAAGEKLGKRLSKTEATGLASRDALPLLGQDGEPVSKE